MIAPKRRTALVASITALAVGLSACTTPDFNTRKNSLDIPRDTSAVVPLPAGARLEEAGTRRGVELEEQTLLGSLEPDARTAAERIPKIVERGYLIVGIQ